MRVHPYLLARVILPLAIAAAFVAITAIPALAEPPPHAKAHGWRKKNDPGYAGYTGRGWERDYGIVTAGRCNTDAVMTAVGGVVGGIIGSQVNTSERTIAVLAGTAIGAIVGNQIGRAIDRTDQGCIGHALELAPDNRPVRWTNEASGVDYQLVPTGAAGANCRNFRLEAKAGGRKESAQRVACRSGDGRWELRR